MMAKFARGTYGSLTFTRTGCAVRVFQSEDAILTGWCLRIGCNVYDGFASRRDAVEGVVRYI